MVASLIMYDRPELAQANAAFWTRIHARLRTRGIAAPPALTRDISETDSWEHPALILSQTCGMPYRTRLHPQVHLVGTPDYGLKGCPPGYYRSAIVVRADDPRETMQDYAMARLAYNSAQSQSGFAAIYAHVAALGFWFESRTSSGAHMTSAKMVISGSADIAAIDAQTWRLLQRFEPAMQELRVLDWTQPTPGLPYITGHAQDPAVIRQCVSEALDDLPQAYRIALDIKQLVSIHRDAYLGIANPPRTASA